MNWTLPPPTGVVVNRPRHTGSFAFGFTSSPAEELRNGFKAGQSETNISLAQTIAGVISANSTDAMP